VTTPLDMSLNDTPCVSCGRCAETCPTGALMPKPRVLQKYEVDESRCILCGICVDACPYDALRDGQEFELSHSSRAEPMIDLMAMAQVDRETEVTYIRKERDWLQRAIEQGRYIKSDRLLTVLPTTLTRGGADDGANGNGAGHEHGGGGSHAGHDHGSGGGSHAHLK
jgi:ferredoxin